MKEKLLAYLEPKKVRYVIACSGMIILCLCCYLSFQKQDDGLSPTSSIVSESIDEISDETMNSNISTSHTEENMTENHQGYVDIKGAVKHPGMYQFESNDRLYDCIQKAGGLTKEADDQRLDYAQKISDQMTIYVPKKGDKKIKVIRMPNQTSASTPLMSTSSSQTDNHEKINLNQADVTQLQTISGIGEKRAQDIIDYRNQKGGFKNIEELKEISGIGDKTFEKLKDSVCL